VPRRPLLEAYISESCSYSFMSRTVSNRIQSLLTTLRDNPVNSEQLNDGVLGEIYSYLMDIPSTPSGDLHWFCEKADIITVDAATFLLRLFAYESDLVIIWKKKFQQCLTCCSSCVGGLEVAKVDSQTTYVCHSIQFVIVP
jgi:senataxin